LFPPLADTLKAVRAVIKQAHLADYCRSLREGRTFPAIACSVALTGRFGNPERPFDINPHGNSQTLFAALRTIASQTAADRALQFAWRLAGATDISSAQVPAYVEETIQAFPELRQAAETFPAPGGGLSVIGPTGQAAQAEAASSTGNHEPQPADPVASVRTVCGRPRPEAQQAARGLRVHFHTVRGATEIAAPGRLDRRAAVLGELIPLRMALPGKERPRPKVLICLDKSGSMNRMAPRYAARRRMGSSARCCRRRWSARGRLQRAECSIGSRSDRSHARCDPKM
jgi:hypothetical protein